MTGKPRHSLSNIRLEEMIGDCKACGPDIVLSLKAGKPCCKTARDLYRRGKYKGNDYISWGNKHPSVKMKMWLEQDKKCALCGKDIPFEDARLDHDHKTLVHRGVLCNSCNLTLGHIELKPADWIAAAYRYLGYKNVKGKRNAFTTTPPWTGCEFIVVGNNKVQRL